MEFIQPSTHIQDVLLVNLSRFADERGVFTECFRREWFPQVSWDKLQSNYSFSRANVLRGLHYHFQQIDYWFVANGHIRAALVDLRPSSPTYLACQTLDMGTNYPIGLFIPIGVAHGFAAQQDSTLIYYVNNYYDGRDEFGVAWNDPAFTLNWGVTEPQLSNRDKGNPHLNHIPDAVRPR